jgi:hypothetical protein
MVRTIAISSQRLSTKAVIRYLDLKVTIITTGAADAGLKAQRSSPIYSRDCDRLEWAHGVVSGLTAQVRVRFWQALVVFGRGAKRHLPHRSWPGCLDGAGECDKHRCLRIACWQ